MVFHLITGRRSIRCFFCLCLITIVYERRAPMGINEYVQMVALVLQFLALAVIVVQDMITKRK